MVVVGLFAFTAVSAASYQNMNMAVIIRQMASLLRNPAMSAFLGRPYALGNAGGFTVWKSGALIGAIGAVWVSLVVTRLTRGAEDTGVFDLLVIGRHSARAITARVAAVVFVVCVLAGAAVSSGFLWTRLSLGPSLLYGAGIALLMATFAGVALVCSQLLAPRRRASSAAVGLVAVAYVVRMVADGTTTTSFLRWATPFGWLEELRAYGTNQWWPLGLFLGAPITLFIVARALQHRRDVGAGLWDSPDRVEPRTRLLQGPWSFAWRERLTLLKAWCGAAVVLSVMLGALVHSFVRLEQDDPNYLRLLRRYGLAEMVTAKGFVAEIDLLLAVAMALFALNSLHLLWADESGGRLDVVLATGISRARWLVAATATTFGGVALLALCNAVAVALGAGAGGASLAFSSTLLGALNAAFLAVPVVGVGLLLHGWAPRFTLGTVSALVASSFVVSGFGPALHWPNWVVDLSVLHHLAQVPAASVAWGAAGVMGAVALGTGFVGFVGYARRDLQ